MDGFKSLPKMQCFKEGGHAKAKPMCYGGKAMKKGGEVDKADMEQDKKMIKKAFKQHDEAEHDKEPTEIKLKKGGRAKKEMGTVRKYKTGGSVENVYGAKKKAGDLDRIEKTKDIKPGKAAAPSKASTKPNYEGSDVKKTNKMPSGSTKAKEVSEKPKAAAAKSGAKEMPNKYKTGGGVKKYADGRSVMQTLGDNIMGTPSQNAIARANEAKYLKAKQMQAASGAQMSTPEKMAMALAGAGQQGGMAGAVPSTPAAMPQTDQMGSPTGMPMQKRGGKVKKACK